MSANIFFDPTPWEESLGVTAKQITEGYRRALVRDGGATIIVDGMLSPAVGSAIARRHFNSDHFELKINRDLGLAVYTKN